MAIHLILLAINEIYPGLKGVGHIFSNCLGALDKVKNLPPSHVLLSCALLDIIKYLLVNCGSLSFDCIYLHIWAHQDDKISYQDLSQPSQLNCLMDFYAKKTLWDLQPMHLPVQQPFLLEPVCIFADARKISVDMCHQLHFLANHKLARDRFHQMDILYSQVFDLVDWEMIFQKLWDVPKMFQLWACKQVKKCCIKLQQTIMN